MVENANMFNNILEGFLTIIKKYGYFNVIASLIILGVSLYAVFNINKIESIVIESIIKKSEVDKIEHDQGMEMRHSVNEKIENHLTAILMKTGADRIMVLEMHNGVNNINGLPFIYVDATYSKYLDGVIPVDTDYINLNMSRFYFFSHAIKNNTWGGNVEDVKVFDSKFSGRMLSNSVNYVYVSTMHGDHFPFGFIILGYGEGTQVLEKTRLEQVMNIYTQKISTLLNPNIGENETD